MNDIFPEIIRFNIPFIFIILVIAAAVFLAYLLYRKTNPDNRLLVRNTLALLRTILLISVLLLFFNPKLFYQFVKEKPKNIYLFIDNSASIGLKNENENRLDSLHIAYSKLDSIFEALDINVMRYSFNQNTSEFNAMDSLPGPNGLTNFDNIIRNAERNGLEQILILSDGINTNGPIPQSNLTLKINTIGIGKKTREADIFISNVDYPPVIYQNEETELTVAISNHNKENSPVDIMIYNETTLISSKRIITNASGTEQQISFKYKLSKSGVQRLRVEIKTPENDSNAQNNTFIVSQEVVRNKLKIGLFSAVPNYEFKFVKFLLEQDKNIKIYPYLSIMNKALTKYPADSLDILFFIGFPALQTNNAYLTQLNQRIITNRQNVVVFLNDYTDFNKLALFNKILPLSTLKPLNNPINGIIETADKSKSIPIIRLFEDRDLNKLFWENVPPIDIKFSLKNDDPKLQVLLEINGIASEDVGLLISENSQNKSVIFNGSGFWRWHFNLQNDKDLKNGYGTLLKNIVRRLDKKDKFKPVLLKANKAIVNPGQEIVFEGYLYDAQNNVIKNGQLSLEAIWQDKSFAVKMERDSSGRFIAKYTPLGEGTFYFKAEGFVDNQTFGRDDLKIQVVPFDREFIRTTQDTLFLKRLATSSGGKYFTLNNIESITQYLDLSDSYQVVDNEIEFRYRLWVLSFIITIAVLEWIIRKRNNLV